MPIERCLACGAEVPAGTGHCYRCLVALGMNPSDSGETDASAGDAAMADPSKNRVPSLSK